MASVNFEKLKLPALVKAMLKHCDKDERSREDRVHSNAEIDKQMTKHNAQMKRSYAETCKRYDERIAYLDAQPGANKRKDRVTCFGLEIPVPKGLPDDKADEFFNKVHKILCKQYGEDNILQCYVHKDEVHDYRDAETGEKRRSRIHCHFYIVPEHDGKLNGKWFSSRKNMMRLNNSIHEMSKADYGLDFMDGTKRKSRKSVEELKNDSRFQELMADLQESLQGAENDKAKYREMLANTKRLQAYLDEQNAEADKRTKSLDERERLLEARQDAFRAETQQFSLEAEKTLEMASNALNFTTPFAERCMRILKVQHPATYASVLKMHRMSNESFQDLANVASNPNYSDLRTRESLKKLRGTLDSIDNTSNNSQQLGD